MRYRMIQLRAQADTLEALINVRFGSFASIFPYRAHVRLGGNTGSTGATLRGLAKA